MVIEINICQAERLKKMSVPITENGLCFKLKFPSLCEYELLFSKLLLATQSMFVFQETSKCFLSLSPHIVFDTQGMKLDFGGGPTTVLTFKYFPHSKRCCHAWRRK